MLVEPINDPQAVCVRCGRKFSELIPFRAETHLAAWVKSVESQVYDPHWADMEDHKYVVGYLRGMGETNEWLTDVYPEMVNDPMYQMGDEDARGDLC